MIRFFLFVFILFYQSSHIFSPFLPFFFCCHSFITDIFSLLFIHRDFSKSVPLWVKTVYYLTNTTLPFNTFLYPLSWLTRHFIRSFISRYLMLICHFLLSFKYLYIAFVDSTIILLASINVESYRLRIFFKFTRQVNTVAAFRLFLCFYLCIFMYNSNLTIEVSSYIFSFYFKLW